MIIRANTPQEAVEESGKWIRQHAEDCSDNDYHDIAREIRYVADQIRDATIEPKEPT